MTRRSSTSARPAVPATVITPSPAASRKRAGDSVGLLERKGLAMGSVVRGRDGGRRERRRAAATHRDGAAAARTLPSGAPRRKPPPARRARHGDGYIAPTMPATPTTVLDARAMERTLTRMADEIVELNAG